MTKTKEAARVDDLLESPNLADVLESDRFRQFLDHVPFGIAVAELARGETLTYANPEFERLVGVSAADLEGATWSALPEHATAEADKRSLTAAVTEENDYLGRFTVLIGGQPVTVDAWSNIIEDDDGVPVFRLVALAESHAGREDTGDLLAQIAEKDTLLKELQHRVKNNLQMITALIRLESRNMPQGTNGEAFQRLAGRINSLALLYNSMSHASADDSIDLGVYLSEIASNVMKVHAVEGIRLNLQVDTWPVSVNVAMPTGLVVNELLTNALKYAFVGRDGGTITLHSLVDDTGCLVTVSDDGIGLADGVTWPKPGKLSALIVHSLKQNAKAEVSVVTAEGGGMRVTMFFKRAAAAPEASHP